MPPPPTQSPRSSSPRSAPARSPCFPPCLCKHPHKDAGCHRHALPAQSSPRVPFSPCKANDAGRSLSDWAPTPLGRTFRSSALQPLPCAPKPSARCAQLAPAPPLEPFVPPHPLRRKESSALPLSPLLPSLLSTEYWQGHGSNAPSL